MARHRRYRMTPARRRALRKAQQASARKRYGAIKHDYSYWAKKGITKLSKKASFNATGKAANFFELVESSKKRKRR